MWRSLTIVLVFGAGLGTALNLAYLDPTKLQTITSNQVQKRAALDIIGKYIEPSVILLEIDHTWFTNNKDTVSLKTIEGKLYIRASTGLAAVWGFNYYLKKYCKSQIEWQTKNVRIPDVLPSVDEVVVANDRFRYYQNVCTVSYSFVWWSVEEWNDHLEWMALNGINLALAPVAQEAAWISVYQKLGMTQEEIDDYLTGPAFLSWLRMGNVHGWGGPPPKSWHDLQTSIQNAVINKMFELGIVPVLPAFNGHVPAAFSRLFPNSTFHTVNKWSKFDSEYCCGLFVDPNDPVFNKVGTMFLNEIKTLGVHIYTADSFNEVKVSQFSTLFVRDTARAIFTTLSNFDKDAVWLLQNWMFVSDPLSWPMSRVQTLMNAVPNGRMLVLDLQSEQWPQYNLYRMYYGQPFIWCMLHNFGGTLGMFGNMLTINKEVYEARSRVNSTMIGVGLTPEGINQNYVVYDLMLESAWRKSPVADLEAWITDYGERRHGCRDTAEGWKYLLRSVYSFDGLFRMHGKYVLTRRPSFKIKPWAWYKSHDLFQAFKRIVFANDSNCNTDGYQYDVVDVTRQALQYRIEQLYVNVVNDRSTNTFVFENSINRFLDAFRDMSLILSESVYFSASNWFNKARNLGTSDDEKYLYETNARNQVTLWGPKGEISDYACKQWDDLVSSYYAARWRTFLSAALEAKKTGDGFNEKATRRVITATVEIPFTTISYEQLAQYGMEREYRFRDAKYKAKSIYRKWVYAPDVEDLPIMFILADKEDPRATILYVDNEDGSSTPVPPTVFID